MSYDSVENDISKCHKISRFHNLLCFNHIDKIVEISNLSQYAIVTVKLAQLIKF